MKFATKKVFLVLAILIALGFIGKAWAQVSPLEFQSESLITGDYNDVVVDGAFMYAATGYGLAIYNISTPTLPVLMSHFGTDGEALSLVKYGNYVYLADGYKGLKIINVSVASNPTITSTLALPGRARAIAMNTAAMRLDLALDEAGIALVNVNNPNSPILMDVEETDRAVDIRYNSGYVYVVDGDTIESYSTSSGFFVRVSQYIGPDYDYHGMTVLNNVLYIANGNYGVIRLAVANGIFTELGTTPAVYAYDCAILGSNIAVALYDRGLMVMNSSGVQLGTFPNTIGDVTAIRGSGNNIYTCEASEGVEIINADNPANMTLLGTIAVAGGPRNIFVEGDYAYVANHAGGFVIMDVSDARTPVVLSTTPLGTWVYDVEVVGNIAYVVEFFSGVYSYDISNPITPTPVDTVVIPYGATGGTRACVSNGSNYLLAVHYDNGLYKIAITPTGIMTNLGTSAINGHPRDVAIDATRNLAFVAGYDGNGAHIYDVSSNIPAWQATYAIPLSRTVGYFNNTLYIGSETAGMHIVNVTTPTAPALISTYDAEGDVDGLTLGEFHQHVFLCSWDRGVEAVNIVDPANPVREAYYDTHSLAKACYSKNSLLYVADSYSMYIFAPGGSVNVTMGNGYGMPNTSVQVPITVSSLTGLAVVSFDMKIAINPDILTIPPTGIYTTTGTLLAGQTNIFATSNITGDTLTVGWFGTVPLTGSGYLLKLNFNIDNVTIGQSSPLDFTQMIFNQGRPVAYTTNGSVAVTNLYYIQGTVGYYSGTHPAVPNMTVNLTGAAIQTTTTNAQGFYSFTSLNTGNYSVAFTKNETTWLPSITLFDATKAAQASAGLIVLTPNQTIAANVSTDGVITMFDASLIAQYTVHIISEFPRAQMLGSDWYAAGNSWSPLNTNVTYNPYGILYGDPSGNWTQTGLAATPIVDNSIIGDYTVDDDIVTVPIMVNDIASEVLFVQFEVNYNPDLLEFQDASYTALTQNWLGGDNKPLIQENPVGHIYIGAYNTTALTATGAVFNLTFKKLSNNYGATLEITNFLTRESDSPGKASAIIGGPTTYALHQNYPNPFNPETTIRYQLKNPGHVSLIIYNSLGQKIRTLVDEVKPYAGTYSAVWDGKDYRNREMSTGIYFYQIKTGDFTDTKKMIMMK